MLSNSNCEPEVLSVYRWEYVALKKDFKPLAALRSLDIDGFDDYEYAAMCEIANREDSHEER